MTVNGLKKLLRHPVYDTGIRVCFDDCVQIIVSSGYFYASERVDGSVLKRSTPSEMARIYHELVLLLEQTIVSSASEDNDQF